MQRPQALEPEKALAGQLKSLAKAYGNIYSTEASVTLTDALFASLANDRFHSHFFPRGIPTDKSKPVRLAEAQGAVEGAEYTESARGKRCGHIFKSEEATYSCRTCQADPTCVLCTKCFHASDHTGHQVYVQMSMGTTGCCDCGDDEAWTRPIQCSIHSRAPKSAGSAGPSLPNQSRLPPELQASIQRTISVALDFLCDVFSCCPEEMRSPKHEEFILHDEEKSRLNSVRYGSNDDVDTKFALVLWNDEKHTVDEVEEQVAKACRQRRSYGREKAAEVDKNGRSIISQSSDLKELLKQARILAQIKVTITIRSTRDTFREEMCNTIVQWLADIAGCSVGDDHDILMNTVCQELLSPWRKGSQAFNVQIAKNGIIDHSRSDDRLAKQQILRNRALDGQAAATMARLQAQAATRVAARAGNAITGNATTNTAITNIPAVPQEQVFTLTPEQAEAMANLLVTNAGEPVPGTEGEDDDLAANARRLLAQLEDEDNDDDDDEYGDDGMDLDEDGLVEMMEGELVEGDEDTAMNAEEMIDVITAANEGPHTLATEESEDEPMESTGSSLNPEQMFSGIPRTPRVRVPAPIASRRPIRHWRKTPKAFEESRDYALHERMDQRVRLDSLILFDLRMWKTLRYSLSHLYISTVITVPSFKRSLGLRFAALYTLLAQLYLVADREPEHSIIHLSLQMLTTPSITAEIVERSNFLTRLLAILYTFLTKRQVGNPEEVDLDAIMSFESGVMSNRRIFHFFQDMRYLLDSPYVQTQIATEPQYLLQFLDFADLSQGICPNVRAVGEHVEYESETWYAAGNIVRDITRLSRQFCESFRWEAGQDAANICRALRQSAKAAILSSLGVEYEQHPQAEHRETMKFKTLLPSTVHSQVVIKEPLRIVDFDVASSPMSFHHALHYTFSWLVDAGKSMSAEQLQSLLIFSQTTLRDSAAVTEKVPDEQPDVYIMAMFDIPLRVCAWLAQMRAGMWVRNGMSLRHQMHFYRGIVHRDVSHRRDVYLLQVAASICEPTHFLASVADRFGMDEWCDGKFTVKQVFDDYGKMSDMAEEMIHLLIVIMSDRTLFLSSEGPSASHAVAKQEIIQALCFKPLTFSELNGKLTDQTSDMEGFQDVLQSLTVYRAPEGMTDSGTFRLKEEYLAQVDPYSVYYSKSQREESDTIVRTHISKSTGRKLEEVVFIPTIRPLKRGVFEKLPELIQSPLFVQIQVCMLEYLNEFDQISQHEMKSPRLESLLHALLHLLLISVLEPASARHQGFIDLALQQRTTFREGDKRVTLVEELLELLHAPSDNFTASKPRIQHLLAEIRQRRPQAFDSALSQASQEKGWTSLLVDTSGQQQADASLKKQQARERQAKVMAAFKQQQNDFLEKQTIDWGVDDDEDNDNDIMADVSHNTWEFPSGTCIFCQEDAKEQELYGTLAFITESNIFRINDMRDTDHIKEVIDEPESDGQTGRGRGFPCAQHQSGPVVTGCGHIMHYSCFQTYEAATSRRHSFQITRNQAEAVGKAEFVCPLCKALGNAFLPIIWRPKLSQPPTTRDRATFTQFLDDRARFLNRRGANFSVNGTAVLAGYAASNYVPSLSSAICAELPEKSVEASTAAPNPRITTSASSSQLSRWRLAPVIGGNLGRLAFAAVAGNTQAPRDTTGRPRLLTEDELMKAYTRLLKTFDTNDMLPVSVGDIDTADLQGIETLTKSLGYSIASVEIAHRGLGGGANYVHDISEPVITNLRIWSETVSSYGALSGANKGSRGHFELQDLLRKQAQSLFVEPSEHRSGDFTSILSQDIFVFLTECSACLIPITESDFYDIMQICYMAEMTKVVLAAIHETASIIDELDNSGPMVAHYQDAEMFTHFVQHFINETDYQSVEAPWIRDPNDRRRVKFDNIVMKMVIKYTTQFLRQVALLVHVRYNVDFIISQPHTEMETEHDVLSRQLGLPSIHQYIYAMFAETHDAPALLTFTKYWVDKWLSDLKTAHNTANLTSNLDVRVWSPRPLPLTRSTLPSFLSLRYGLPLSHPGIYNLTPLPATHDMLNALAMTHTCPTTGGPLDDPALCLFCGAFLCSQARCCRRANPATHQQEGGSNIHQRSCGGNVGIFLNIRKCAVLMLHGRNGSWFPAPYLDRYGEIDLGLRRKEQLFLSESRYNKLYRDVWLAQGIPTTVARKLENDVNTGGWEGL
jgi:E3 ubiquitin-protein ligase UBR1